MYLWFTYFDNIINNFNEESKSIITDVEGDSILKNIETDTVELIETGSELIADNKLDENIEANIGFRDVDELEVLIKMTLRNFVELKVSKPVISQRYKKGLTINFEWETNIEEKVIIKLFNNKEDKVAEISANGNSANITSNKLKKGLYYWKLETEEDLYYVGKIYID